MRLVSAPVKLKTVRVQALPQRIGQIHQLPRHMARRSIHDMVMPPVARLVETQLEALPADLLRRQLQCLQGIQLHVADERQRVVQCLAAHRAPAAQAFQRRLPRGQLRGLGGGRPQGEKYPCGRIVGWMIHTIVILSA